MKKLLVLVGTIAMLGLGAFALNAVMPASASTTAPQSAAQAPEACGTRTGIKEVLDSLVADGTITAEQETKILDALKAGRESNKAAKEARGPRDPGRKLKALKEAAQVSADKIGIPLDELKSALKGGQTVADVATAHNVAPADVEQAIVEAATAKVDAAVAAGTLDEQRAGFLKARLPEMANAFVNHVGHPKAEPCGGG